MFLRHNVLTPEGCGDVLLVSLSFSNQKETGGIYY
jgi:hypothetical protein